MSEIVGRLIRSRPLTHLSGFPSNLRLPAQSFVSDAKLLGTELKQTVERVVLNALGTCPEAFGADVCAVGDFFAIVFAAFAKATAPEGEADPP